MKQGDKVTHRLHGTGVVNRVLLPCHGRPEVRYRITWDNAPYALNSSHTERDFEVE